MWKWEEGFEDGETPVGPAWIATLGDAGKRISTEDVAGGEWIARDERFASRAKTTTTCSSKGRPQRWFGALLPYA